MKRELSIVYEKARPSLVSFRQIFLPTTEDLPSAGFHRDWSNDLLYGTNHICYEGFRESAKTSYVMRIAPLHSLVYPSPEWQFVVIIKANQRHARRSLKTISDEYVGNPLLNVNLRKVVKNTADAFEVVIWDPVSMSERHVLIEEIGRAHV